MFIPTFHKPCDVMIVLKYSECNLKKIHPFILFVYLFICLITVGETTHTRHDTQYIVVDGVEIQTIFSTALYQAG